MRDAILSGDLDSRIDSGLEVLQKRVADDAELVAGDDADRLAAEAKRLGADVRESVVDALKHDGPLDESFAALLERKRGEALQLVEKEAPGIGGDTNEGLVDSLTKVVGDDEGAVAAAAAELGSLARPALDRTKDTVAQTLESDEVLKLMDEGAGVSDAVRESRAANQIAEDTGRLRAALEAEAHRGALATLLGPNENVRAAEHHGDALKAKAREVAAKLIASKILDGRAFFAGAARDVFSLGRFPVSRFGGLVDERSSLGTASNKGPSLLEGPRAARPRRVAFFIASPRAGSSARSTTRSRPRGSSRRGAPASSRRGRRRSSCGPSPTPRRTSPRPGSSRRATRASASCLRSRPSTRSRGP